MTNPINPRFVDVDNLPIDTVTVTATGATFTLAPSLGGGLVAQLAINTVEMGAYVIVLDRDVLASVLTQAQWLNSLTAEQAAVIANTLHNPDAGD